MSEDFDIIVIGGALAGATAALALARRGHSVAIAAPAPAKTDGRTTALLMPAIGLLSDLHVWDEVAPNAAALATMRIVDGSRRLLRAPTVSFHASEIDETAFGYNIPNAALLDTLHAAIKAEPSVTTFETAAAAVDPHAEPARVTLTDGQVLTGRLIVAADGRQSLARAAVGITTRDWRYPQSALVLTFRHSRPHDGISTEFHTESGPFTQVPLPGDRSSLVWVEQPQEAERLAALPVETVNEIVETRMQSMLGKIEIDSAIQTFPLSGMVASAFGKGPVALVGEAGHAFPPIGAQGLNLGMRDVMEMVRQSGDLSSRAAVEAAVGRYDRARRADIRSRTTGIDLLNRSLLTGFLPVQLARAAGLSVLSSAGPLRRFAMREGLSPGAALRSLVSSGKKIGR